MKYYLHCDCCGEFKREGTLYTLFGMAKPVHPFEEGVAICMKCSRVLKKDAAKCKDFLDRKQTEFDEAMKHKDETA